VENDQPSGAPMRFITADRSAYCNSCGTAIEGDHQCAVKPRSFITAGSTNVQVQEGFEAPPRADNLRAYSNSEK